MVYGIRPCLALRRYFALASCRSGQNRFSILHAIEVERTVAVYEPSVTCNSPASHLHLRMIGMLYYWRARVASETLTGVTQLKIGDVCLYICLDVRMSFCT